MTNAKHLPHGRTESRRTLVATLPRFVAPLYGAWRTPGRRWLEMRPLVVGGTQVLVVVTR